MDCQSIKIPQRHPPRQPVLLVPLNEWQAPFMQCERVTLKPWHFHNSVEEIHCRLMFCHVRNGIVLT